MTVIAAPRQQLVQFHLDQQVGADREQVREATAPATHNHDERSVR